MAIESAQLLLLLNWMSPAFPIGAFAYSHGLEWSIDAGGVESAEDVESWIGDVIARGSGWNDAVLFAQAYSGDPDEVNELALALATSRERYLETTQLGRAFETAASAFVTSPMREARKEEELDIAYPVAAAVACRTMGIGKSHALLAFLQGFVNALVSVAVRLVPLGQTQGLETIRNLMPVLAATAARAETAKLDDLGSIAIASDIAAMKHETQFSRVFRT
jgi:urease accessory protein